MDPNAIPDADTQANSRSKGSPGLNLNHLGVFHSIAEEGSVSRGARRLLISQPAASKQLRLLERAAGGPLFDRHAKGVRLTAAGELLASYARRLFALATEAEDALAELRGGARGRLAVAAGTTPGLYLLPDVFVRFRRDYPAIQLRLDIAPAARIRQALLEGTADLGLTEGEVDPAGLAVEALAADPLVAIAAPGHPLARRRTVSLGALCREPFVVRETGSASKSLVERALAERGLSIHPAMALGGTEAIKRAVAAGVGVAVVSRLAIGLEREAGRLVTLKVPGLSIRRPLWLLRPAGRHPSRASEAFVAMLRRER